MESNDVNENNTSKEGEQPTVSPDIDEEGEEIVVEYNHNDYIDLVGPLCSPLAQSVQPQSSVVKMPGNLPPFALYMQEQRPKVQQDHPDISFGEVGRKVGEKWQTLKVNLHYSRTSHLVTYYHFSRRRRRSTN